MGQTQHPRLFLKIMNIFQGARLTQGYSGIHSGHRDREREWADDCFLVPSYFPSPSASEAKELSEVQTHEVQLNSHVVVLHRTTEFQDSATRYRRYATMGEHDVVTSGFPAALTNYPGLFIYSHVRVNITRF